MSHEICGVFQYLLQIRKTENTQLNTKVNTIYAAPKNVGTNMFSVPGILLYLYNVNRPLLTNSCISQGQGCRNTFLT